MFHAVDIDRLFYHETTCLFVVRRLNGQAGHENRTENQAGPSQHTYIITHLAKISIHGGKILWTYLERSFQSSILQQQIAGGEQKGIPFQPPAWNPLEDLRVRKLLRLQSL